MQSEESGAGTTKICGNFLSVRCFLSLRSDHSGQSGLGSFGRLSSYLRYLYMYMYIMYVLYNNTYS